MWWALIPAMMQAGGNLLNAGGQTASAKIQQAELRRQANADLAKSSLDAEQSMREANLNASRTLAVGAASGGGASSPDVIRRMSEIMGQGERQAMYQLYSGKTSYRNQIVQGKYGRLQARSAARSAILGSAAQVGQEYANQSMYSKYGGGGFNSGSSRYGAVHESYYPAGSNGY